MSDISLVIFFGVIQGGVYAAVALGLVLVFGVTDILNFAHGALITIGAFTVVLLQPDIGIFPAIAVAGAGVGLVSGVLYQIAFRFTIGDHLRALGLSLGLLTLFNTFVLNHFDTLPRRLPTYLGHVELFGGRVAVMRLVVLAVLVLIVLGFYLVLKRTWIGLALRVCGVDGDALAASSLGLSARRVGFYAFVASGVFAAVAGVAIALLYPITPFSGQDFLLKGFVIVVIGGLGSVSGAVIASMSLGLLEALGGWFLDPAYTDLYGFVFMILILMLMPDGLFNRAARRAG